ncbi:MAG: HAMP domain-containing sensor histidine kinase [Nitrospirota bacterium]
MFNGIKNIVYHILIFVLSAAIALSLPYTGKFIADNYVTYWSLIESNKTFLIFVEIAIAVILIMVFNGLVRSWKDRKFSKMAMIDMGLVLAADAKSLQAKKKVKQFKEQEGFVRDVLLIGSTGFDTFVNPEGDLHRVIQNCREAKIMLLKPTCEGACVRSKSIPDPEITPESYRDEIMKSIAFLKDLKALQKNIRLKLYEETPLLKLAILGDYLFMKYYHSVLNEEDMPEYIFKHSPDHSSLFDLFYQIFLSKWRDPDIPEYDFDTDELIYRDISGNELKREKLEGFISDQRNTEERTKIEAEHIAREQAESLKSDFLSLVSHELRTPLVSIIGYNDLLLDRVAGGLNEEQIDALKKIDKNSKKLLELINSVLDLSRLEAKAPEIAEVDLPQLLEEIKMENKSVIENSGLDFVWKIDPGLQSVGTDTGVLKVILVNLISNAVKFTEKGSVTVDIHRSDSGVEFSVVDTGIGIAPEDISNIFEPFHQLENPLTREHEGIGLGLYIVGRLVDFLGGSIKVESEVGRGTVFTVQLPVAVEVYTEMRIQ